MRVGVLALQGDVREHAAILDRLDADAVEVRRPEDLEDLDGLILPGGESTTIGKLATLYGLVEPLEKVITGGLPTYGTCAGLILLARAITEGDQPLIGVLNVVAQRNAFGNQNHSFETDLDIEGLDEPFPAVFIRAPWVAEVGEGVHVLASWNGYPVMVRQGHIMASAFHPELTDDSCIHEMLLDMIEES